MNLSTSSFSDSGFSLMEILIATFIMAILSAMGVALLTNTLRTREHLEIVSDEIQRIELARAMIKEDMSQLANRRVRDAYGDLRPYTFDANIDIDPEKILSFTRNGHIAPGLDDSGPSLQFVEYYYKNDSLFRSSRYRLDATPQTPTRERLVLANITNLQVSFFTGSDWVSEWGRTGAEGGALTWPLAVSFEFDTPRYGAMKMTFLTPEGY